MAEERTGGSLEKIILDDNSNKFVQVINSSKKFRNLKKSEKNKGKTEKQLFADAITGIYCKDKKQDKEKNEK